MSAIIKWLKGTFWMFRRHDWIVFPAIWDANRRHFYARMKCTRCGAAAEWLVGSLDDHNRIHRLRGCDK